MESKRLWVLTGVALAVLSAQGVPMAQTAAPAPAVAAAAAVEQPAFSQEQIEQMVAPIALYPDALLAQVLMSATYPLEIVQAARWVKKNPDVKGEALDTALREQPWDPSVKTLAMFPSVLERMNENLDWTQDLGDAFLAQEQDVMDAVQRLRHEAQKTGALKDTPQQKVVVEKETIVVEPADPQTVYVPTYDPSAVYGQPPPAAPYYPTVYQQPVYTTSTTDSAVAFGAGALVGGLLTAAIMWDDDDDWDGYHVWHHGPGYWDNDWPGPRYGSNNWNNWRGDTNINGDVCVGRCTSIDRDSWRQNANSFQHNPVHRGGVKYREGDKVAARYPEVNRPSRPGGIDRDTARGKERPTTLPAQTRPGDRTQVGTGDRRPAGTAKPADRPQLGGGDRERPGASTRPAERPQLGGGGDRERPGAETRPAERPKVASADRPKAESRPAQRPQAEARPAQRPQAQTRPAQAQAPERSVSQAPKLSKPTAFQSGGSGSFERQASARGAASRGGGGMQGGGGGGMRGGGGGGARGGGGGGRGGGGGGRGR
jgi:hypothetical protein